MPLLSEQVLKQYTRCLMKEVRQRALSLPGIKIKTIYFGGGTPSLLTSKQMIGILEQIYKFFNLEDNIEISLEANPATLNRNLLNEYMKAGINRISLGVQSFNDEELEILGRSHNCKQVVSTIDLIKSAGVDNFNLDLIYGIPGQSIDKWLTNLYMAIETNPTHISTYLLQLDSSTPLASEINLGKLHMLGEETELNMYYKGINLLESYGYTHYEISNFARTGYECRHNLVYWKADEYLGIGCGAVSFINNKRTINVPNIRAYLHDLHVSNKWKIEELEAMSRSELIGDALILGLRLCRGINIEQFNQRFHIDMYQDYKDIIDKLINRGLLQVKDGWLSLTSRGYFLSNEVFCQLI